MVRAAAAAPVAPACSANVLPPVTLQGLAHAHQLRLWGRWLAIRRADASAQAMGRAAPHRLSFYDQPRPWPRRPPIGAAFMISQADGPGAAHRAGLYDQPSLSAGGAPISSAYTSTPVLLCSYAHSRMLVRLYYSTPVLLRMILITIPTGGNRARA